MRVSRPKYLELVRRLALVGSTVAPAWIAACGGSANPPVTGGTSVAPPSSSASTTSTSESTGGDFTAGGGACRCSWDPDAAAAPRVCKRGEINYAGNKCIPGSHPSYEEGYYPPAVGPLPPPELA